MGEAVLLFLRRIAQVAANMPAILSKVYTPTTARGFKKIKKTIAHELELEKEAHARQLDLVLGHKLSLRKACQVCSRSTALCAANRVCFAVVCYGVRG